MNDDQQTIRLLNVIAELVRYIAASVAADQSDNAEMKAMTDQLAASHDRLQAAVTAVPPAPPTS